MSLSFDARLTLISVVAVLVAIIVAAYAGTPAIMNRITVADAETLSLRWLDGITKQFDLPGQPPEAIIQEDSLIDRLLLPSPTNAAEEDVNVFQPSSFEAGAHLSAIRGYVVFTPYGDRFVSGGTTIERTVQRQPLKEHFELVLERREMRSFITGTDGVVANRVVSVMVPLLRDGRVNGVALVDVERGGFEKRLFEGIRRGAVLTAGAISVVALGMLALLLQWGHARRAAEDEASFLAHHDALTGLPNRRQFNARFEQLLRVARNKHQRLALLCIDIDCFKEVNDVYGHLAGDQLLIGVSKRLQDVVGTKGFVSRLSGDEFTVLLDGIDGARDANRICDAIMAAQREPLTVDGHRVAATLSIGVSLFPTDGDGTEELLKHADLALYKAKADGRDCYRFFAPVMDLELRRRRSLQNSLRLAVEADQLEVHYQPQVDISSGQIIAFEALCRWTHPKEGPIPPSEFIPIAEDSGLISRLGAWVLETACREACGWSESVGIAVNLSPQQFHDGDIVAVVRNALDISGLDPARLELEITEGVLLRDIEAVSVALAKLRDLGVGIAMDDFGTGYSSLGYLTRIPFTKIKIDRSFIHQMGSNTNVDTIISSIIGIGNSLNIHVTAEGVETFAQLNSLKAAGCHVVQGFLYGRPSRDPFAASSRVIELQSDVRNQLLTRTAS